MSETGFIIVKKKKRFVGLSPLAFEHPMDAAALLTLKKVPAVDKILRLLFRVVHEKRRRLVFLSSTVRVSPKQFSYIYDLYQEAMEILDVEHVPELFVAQTPEANAFAYGIDKPFIVLNSALLDMFEPAELQVILAHELGHVIAGHMLYVSVLISLLQLLQAGGVGFPFGNIGLQAVVTALYEWYRKAELTCDRAGLLVAQEVNVCHRVEMKLAGGRHIEHMDIGELFKQAEEYEAQDDVLDSIYKVLNNMHMTHPHPVARMRELQRWNDEGNYKDILEGQYITRADEEHADATARWREAMDSFQQDVQRGSGGISQVLSDLGQVGEGIVNAGNNLWDRLFGGNTPTQDENRRNPREDEKHRG